MNVSKYGRLSVRFSAHPAGNPFDVDFSVHIATPDGNEISLSGFYDGNDEYVFRFMPQHVGQYQYRTHSSLPELDGKTGIFFCESSTEGNHGPVRVKDQYWFAYADGTSYFEAGTTCYAWIHQTAELQAQTLQTLAAGYFNKLRMCVFPKWFEYNHRQPELYPFEGNLTDGFDYDRPNVSFFRHLEQCVEKLEGLGIEADIILFHPYETETWGFNWMSEEQDRRYLRYILARLSSYHNVWWSLANEYDLFQTGYKQNTSAWRELLEFVHVNDPYGHLTSIHQLSQMYDHRDPNVTHCSIQRTEMFVTAEYTDTWRKEYGKPVVIDECAYEGNLNPWWGGITAQELVRRFWEAAARGGYMGHSETYLGENIWWSHGGQMYGESAPRIKFLREIMEGCPNIQFTSESGLCSTASASAGQDAQLIYLGNYQPCKQTLQLPDNGRFKVSIIDTWNMTVENLPGRFSGTVDIALPSIPHIAILCIAEK